jgi:hypothetical protein
MVAQDLNQDHNVLQAFYSSTIPNEQVLHYLCNERG